MAGGEADNLAEKLFIDLPEDVGGEDGKFVRAFGIIEAAQNVAEQLVVQIEREREFVRVFVAALFFLEVEQAGVVAGVGVLKELAQARINAVAVDEGAEPAVILDTAVFANAKKDDAVNDALDGEVQFALRELGIAQGEILGEFLAPAFMIGNSLSSIAVTMPKLPPPPRSAQNRSGSVSRSVRTSRRRRSPARSSGRCWRSGHTCGRGSSSRRRACSRPRRRWARSPPAPPARGGRRPRRPEPEDAGLHARDAVHRIDLDAAHPLGLEQDRVLERAERAGIVARALRRDSLVELAREQNSRCDILRRLRKHDRHGSSVDRQVPGSSRFVEARVLGDHDLARESRSQRARRAELYLVDGHFT